MKDLMDDFAPALAGLDRDDWLDALEDLAEEHGYFEPLGNDHSAAFIDAGTRLLVTFETYDDIVARSPGREPRGFEFVKSEGWSHLAIIANGPGWFRNDRLYRYFDRLVDDGFFEDFEQVLFFGSHQGGYAAAAYAVAAPGARVLALRPVATLDPAVAGFDSRYRQDRRLCFTDRYGYAPDMIDAVDRAWVAYDPNELFDAMHAALFTRPNVQKVRVMALGNKLDIGLDQFGATTAMIAAAMDGSLTPARFGAIFRARHGSVHYLRYLLALCERNGKSGFGLRVCETALALGPNPFFTKRRDILAAKLAQTAG